MTKKETTIKAKRYFEGVGRRKTATARVRLTPGGEETTVNEKPIKVYFPTSNLAATALQPLTEAKLGEKYSVSARVSGGGVRAQAEAVRHGLGRALVKFDPDLKKKLRVMGFLTRDPRMVERKKYGLKKARRAPQWAKR